MRALCSLINLWVSSIHDMIEASPKVICTRCYNCAQESIENDEMWCCVLNTCLQISNKLVFSPQRNDLGNKLHTITYLFTFFLFHDLTLPRFCSVCEWLWKQGKNRALDGKKSSAQNKFLFRVFKSVSQNAKCSSKISSPRAERDSWKCCSRCSRLGWDLPICSQIFDIFVAASVWKRIKM